MTTLHQLSIFDKNNYYYNLKFKMTLNIKQKIILFVISIFLFNLSTSNFSIIKNHDSIKPFFIINIFKILVYVYNTFKHGCLINKFII